MSCLLSHHVLPTESILKFHDHLLLPLTSSLRLCCALPQPDQQDLTPHSSLLLHHTILHQSLHFLSIIVPACNLREWFNHLWPNPSFNDVQTLQGPPAPYKCLFSQFAFSATLELILQGMQCVCWETRCTHVWKSPAVLPHILTLLRPWPVFGLFMSACWESPKEVSHVPEKAYGTIGM